MGFNRYRWRHCEYTASPKVLEHLQFSTPEILRVIILSESKELQSSLPCSFCPSEQPLVFPLTYSPPLTEKAHHQSIPMSHSKPPQLSGPTAQQHLAPFQAAWERHAPAVPDPSVLHPVFFTPRLIRQPPSPPQQSQLPHLNGAMSPVAYGYVYHPNGPQIVTTGKSKL